jgi:putative ABC transport system permease protein
MSLFSHLRGMFKSVFKGSPGPDVLDRELDFHVEELTRRNVHAGMDAKEARRQALLEFGGREQMRQSLRETHRSRLLDAVIANMCAAWRFVRRSPVFSVTVIATLAIAIGANAAVFSAVDAVLLRPLAFPHGDELVELKQVDFKAKNPSTLVAPPRLEDWNRMNTTFQGIAGWYTEDDSDLSGPLPTRVENAVVTPRFFQALGVTPLLGRDFTPAEEHFGGPGAILISYGYWHRRFHGNPHIVGTTLHSGEFAMTVVGVMPQSFQFPNADVEVWKPNAPDAPYSQSRAYGWFTTIGRLKPGVPQVQGLADLKRIQRQLGRQYAQTDADLTVQMEPLKQVVLQDAGDSLWLLYGAVTLLLVLACVNIATLLLARTSERRHEIAIRHALGASRRAIVLQLLSEVFALALAGALLGLAMAGGATQLFRLCAQTLPRVNEIALDWRVVAYALACSVAVTLACGLFPALRGTGPTLRGKERSIAASMAQGSRTQVSTRIPLQWALVGTQVALAAALLVGAGLLLRSLAALGAVNPGFRSAHVMTLHISGSYAETTDYPGLIARVNHDLDTIRALPGVEAAATSAMLPGIGGAYPSELVSTEGVTTRQQQIVADDRYVSDGYFKTLGIPLLQGHACPADSPYLAMVVNRSFASRYLADTSVLGYHLRGVVANGAPGVIVGVVGDAREEVLTTAPQPTVYWCGSAPDPDPNYLIRTHGNPMALANTVRVAIHRIEPGRSVYKIAPLAEAIGQQSADTRLRTTLLALIALVAIALVSLGLWGTTAYLARLREPEIGLRLALGAMPAQIARRFLVQSLRVAALGCAAGLAVGAALSTLLGSMLYATSTLDPLTYIGVALLVMAVSLGAALAPSLRASRVEPVRVLRNQ